MTRFAHERRGRNAATRHVISQIFWYDQRPAEYYESPRPLTKRQRRRARGKGKL